MGTKIGTSVIVLSIVYGFFRLYAGTVDWTDFSIMTVGLFTGVVIWGYFHKASSLAVVTVHARNLVINEGTRSVPPTPTFPEPSKNIASPSAPVGFPESSTAIGDDEVPLPPPHPAGGPIRRLTPPHLRLVHDTGEPVDSHDFRRRHSSGH